VNIHDLPLLNALLNGSSALCLLAGFYFIRRREIRKHRVCMIAAFVCSALFLISYVVYHANVGSIRFAGEGSVRALYFTILVSHTLLAATVPALAIITLRRALRARFEQHRKIARWVLPVWLYVSVTGVVIYLMLYRIYPSAWGV
jgi:putative membrane protein